VKRQVDREGTEITNPQVPDANGPPRNMDVQEQDPAGVT
jgi:hypothetical protein